MKPALIFVSGLIAAAAGVFTRSCAPRIPDGLLTHWCGGTPPSSLLNASHLHCGGCALTVAGIGLIAISALLAIGARRALVKEAAR